MLKTKTFIIHCFLAIATIAAFALTKKSFHATFHNRTGYDIDSLYIGATYIGLLAAGDSTENISFRKFEFDGGQPYEEINGKVKKTHLSQLYWSWCGTMRESKTNGNYTFDIKAGVDSERKMSLYLVKHGSRIFEWQ